MRILIPLLTACCASAPLFGQSGSAAAEMARKLQDPLANIAAVMTDNDILFNTGNDEASYQWQIQPVKAFSFDSAGFNFIARGVIPILGVAPEGQRPAIGDPLPPGDSHTWGLGDITTQFFFSPKTASAWKFGLGPQVSWRTRTDSNLGGPSWGGGPVGVIVGSLSENTSLSVITGHLWGAGGDFSTTLIQPMVFYNFSNLPGVSLGYNAAITHNWKASEGTGWTVPLGANIGKTFDLGEGFGLDLNGGVYWNASRPTGAPNSQIKYGVSLIFP